MTGTAVSGPLLDGTSSGLRGGLSDKTSAANAAHRGVTLLGRGRAFNETRPTEIPTVAGMGALAQNPAIGPAAADRPRHAEVLLRAPGHSVSAPGLPVRPARQ